MALDPFQSCPSTVIFPTVYGVAEPNSDFNFVADCNVDIQSIDHYGKFVIAGGTFTCSAEPAASLPDLETNYCNVDNASKCTTNRTSGNRSDAVFNFYHTD